MICGLDSSLQKTTILVTDRKLAVLVHADVVGSTALVKLNETLAHEPADRGPILEQRVHPRIWVGVVRWRRAIDRVAASVCTHRHD